MYFKKIRADRAGENCLEEALSSSARACPYPELLGETASFKILLPIAIRIFRFPRFIIELFINLKG